MNSFNFGGQDGDPEIVRENFNKIARYLTAADACVLSLQSESADISALGANAVIRNFTVFMRSDTDVCDVTIPDPAIFALSVIGKKDTLFFFKGLSGASTKTININTGTVEGVASLTLANDQTICIQSDGTEYKILFDSTSMGSGSGDVPDLQEVTDVGYITNHSLVVLNNFGAVQAFGDAGTIGLSLGFLSGSAVLAFIKNANTSSISSDNVVGNRALQLPNGDGTLVLTVNGNAADAAGNVNTTGGSGDTVTIYTGDDALASDRTVDLNGKFLSFQQAGSPMLLLNPVGNNGQIAQLITAGGTLAGNSDISAFSNDDDGYGFEARANDGTNTVNINGDAQANTINYNAANHAFGGLLTFSNYGSGTNTGTPTFGLAVDASGNIIEISTSGGGTRFGVFGEDASAAQDRDFNGNQHQFTIEHAGGIFLTADYADYFANISITAPTGDAGNISMQVLSNITSTASDFQMNEIGLLMDTQNIDASVDVNTTLKISRLGGTTSSGNIGQSIDFIQGTLGGSTGRVNRIISRWTDYTDASLTSQLSFVGVNNAVENTLFIVEGAGLRNFANDAAAAVGGVPTKAFYRNGSSVMQNQL